MINLKKYLNKKNDENIHIYLFLFCLVILFYSTIYVLSFLKVVNFWSYSQSFMSYSEGFIKRNVWYFNIFFENIFITQELFFLHFTYFSIH